MQSNYDALLALGPGSHFGEWWGSGIQRGYGVTDKRFSLFNVGRWVLHGKEPGDRQVALPSCVGLVPVLFTGMFDMAMIDAVLDKLKREGSAVAPGYMNPEGVVVYHEKARVLFKKTLDGDGHKSVR